jgi:protein-L-isoaspartate O-methyltransferase
LGAKRGRGWKRFDTLLASGQITMRKVDGWEGLPEKPFDQIIDLAA